MQAQFIRHVRDLILIVLFAREDLQRAVFSIVALDRGPRIASFRQTAFEDFHDAVGVCVAVESLVLRSTG
jgi:hypothetical protein